MSELNKAIDRGIKEAGSLWEDESRRRDHVAGNVLWMIQKVLQAMKEPEEKKEWEQDNKLLAQATRQAFGGGDGAE